MKKLLKALFWPDENLWDGLLVFLCFVAIIGALFMWRLTLSIAIIVAAVYSAGSLFGSGFKNSK